MGKTNVGAINDSMLKLSIFFFSFERVNLLMLQQRDPVIYLSYCIYLEGHVSAAKVLRDLILKIRGRSPLLVLLETDVDPIMRVTNLLQLRHQMHLYKPDPVS